MHEYTSTNLLKSSNTKNKVQVTLTKNTPDLGFEQKFWTNFGPTKTLLPWVLMNMKFVYWSFPHWNQTLNRTIKKKLSFNFSCKTFF